MRRALGLVVGLVAFAMGCRALPDIAAGECGNHVVEAGEDCDSFGRDGFSCLPRDASGACHLRCKSVAPSEGLACPAGFGCDDERVCRRASGNFVTHQDLVPGDYEAVLSADLDGDGRDDVVGLGVQDSLGQRHYDVNYFDGSPNPTDRWSTTDLLANQLVTKLSRTAERASVLASGSAFGIMLGERDHTLSPDVHPSYYAPQVKIKVVAIWHEQVDNASPLLVLAEAPGASTVLGRPVTDSEQLLQALGEVSGDFASLTASAVELFTDAANPCDELVVAALGADRATVFQACDTDARTGAIRFRDRALVTTIRLPDGAVVSAAALAGDVDGDGHADLVLMTDHGPYVAAGDGAALADPTPLALPLVDPRDGSLLDGTYAGNLLAMGDFSADGRADFVTPDGYLLSTTIPEADGAAYFYAPVNIGPEWSEAVVADLTGDGLLDVVSASDQRTDMDLLAGTGNFRPGTLVIPTTHPVRHLALGDFDGDRVVDLAFAEPGAAPDGEDEFLIAFGGDYATLGSPIPAGHVESIADLVALADNYFDNRHDLIVNHWLSDETGAPGSALSFVEGDAHRQFIAPIQLSDTKLEGAVNRGEVLSLAAGHFRTPEQADALAIGMSVPVNTDRRLEWALWYLPAMENRASSLKQVGWGFDPAIAPCDYSGELGRHTTVRARLVAGDVDGDGLDEAIVAAPNEDGQHCVVQTASIDAAGATVVPSDALVLDEPCVTRPSLAVVDLDGDGQNDLVLLTGGPGAPGRLLVLWNQGGGRFDSRAQGTLVAASAAPRAFSPHLTDAATVPSVAYVTDQDVHLLAARPGEREFTDTVVAALAGGTGIASGDVNGDGLADLVVAANGNIGVLTAGLAE